MAKLSSTSVYGNLYVDGEIVNNALDAELGQSIKSLSVNGKTITYTKNDGTTGTIETQDTNTTYGNATTSTSGLMSSADKTKLDGIAANANNYSHPTTSGNKHIPAGGSSGQILRWASDGTATWGNDNNTTYSTGTASTAGLTKLYTGTGTATDGTMTQAALKTALDGKADSSHTHSYLPLSGGTLTGDTTFNKYIKLNAWPNYGTGTANFWYDANNKTVAIENATNLTLGGTAVSKNGHTHNSLMATDLSGLTVSLNNYNLSSGTPKVAYYFCPSDGSGSNITGRPNDSDKKAFNLVVESLRFVSNTDYITKQTYTQGSQKIIYVRYCTNGTWTAWEKVYTSVQKPTASEIGAAASSHTHNYAGSSSAGGNANAAIKLATARSINGTNFDGTGDITTAKWGVARTIGLSGDMSGSVSIDGSANATITARRRHCICGQTTTADTTNCYFKVASFSTTSNYTDARISFYVSSDYSATDGGILHVLCRRGNEASSIDLKNLVWDYAYGINSSDFQLVSIISGTTTTFELWLKVTSSHRCYRFNVIDEGNRGNANNIWTLHNSQNTASSTGGKSAVTSGGTVTNSTFSSISNNSYTATRLQTARSINGTNFDGSANITTANWGTARNIQIGNTTKSVNGSANVSWSLSEIGAAAASHGRHMPDTCETITDWNNATKSGWYMGNNAANGPTTIASGGTIWYFGEVIAHNTNYVIQVVYQFTASTDAKSIPKYIRAKMNGTWGAWTNVTVSKAVPSNAVFTDTNTWRGVQDNLTSTATDQSLSANQGKVLKGLIDEKAASNHTHSYLPLSGGTMTGAITSSKSTGTHLEGNRGTGAIINSTAAGSGYNMLVKMNSSNGAWTMGSWNNTFNLFYTTNSIITEGNNTYTKRLTLLDENGNSSFPGTITGSLSGNASTATKLQTVRTINGTNFDGTGNITTANWGAARNIQIGDTAKSVNGSANVTWTLGEIGAAASNHTHGLVNLNSEAFSGGNDLNTYNSTKTWVARTLNSTTNKPADYFTVVNFGANSNSNFQLAHSYANNSTLYVRGRHDTSGNYTPWAKIYTDKNKPTASEIGAAASSHTHNYLPLTGGTLSGNVVLNNNIAIGGKDTSGTTKWLAWVDKANNAQFGDVAIKSVINSNANPEVNVGGKGIYTLYHTGNKPTAAEVGALPLTGGTLTGDLTISGNSKNVIIGTGGKDVYMHNSASGHYLQLKDDGMLMYSDNKIYHAGNKPTPSEIGAAPALVLANSYYGMVTNDGNSSNWIRTTKNGILPYASGGSSYLGASGWPFNEVYATNFYGTLNGNATHWGGRQVWWGAAASRPGNGYIQFVW